MRELNKTYDPKDFEKRLYDFWMENDYFVAEIDENKKPFTIVMPPPNVTGNLHMGHALNNVIQDIVIRFKRMDGYSALWVPGTDHASISTEAKVVEKIKSEGKSKESLGREAFLEEAWAWTRKYGGNIKNQLKKLGVSCDWSRERFTLDENLSRAVEEVFIELYEKGLIYRGDRIINWCPSCKTAISDAEVEHIEADGHIWTFKYPLEDGSGYIEIATTRPETIPGDLAIAVNPEDERYKDLVGKYALLPIMDNKKIPILADSYVEMEFGTGAVKITPSHDINDFEVGERHNLGQYKIMDDYGYLNENAGKYNEMERFEARKAIIQDFKNLGLFVEEKDHNNAVGHCERCGTVIEPIISKQWFVKMKPLAEPALKAYTDGELNLIPDRFGKVYIHWLEDIKDWCISRQLWWGHRLPVYYDLDTGETIVSRTDPRKESKYANRNIVQDEDTLDTWFSSALWAFSTLGWPEDTDDLKYFYPTDLLVTGYDIIFFWVIRMVFSSLEQMGSIPFKDVYFTGLIRDSQGRKMSKSLGNGIDPLELIEDYGADALRFMLVTGNSPGNDMRFFMERVETARNFANKLWNASRFVFMNLEDDFESVTPDVETLEVEDKWILSKLQGTIKSATEKLNKYDIGMAGTEIHDFIWEDFCDWYIEMVKPRLYGEEEKSKSVAKNTLVYVLKDILKLLHPFMPFITEEIWGHMNEEKALIVEEWPKYNEEYYFEKELKDITYVQGAIKAIRNARSEMNIENGKKSMTIFYSEEDTLRKTIEENASKFITLASSLGVKVVSSMEELDKDNISIVLEGGQILLPLKELVDFEKELERLRKEEEKLQSEIERASKKLANKSFVDKAPASVVEEEREKLEKYKTMLETVEGKIKEIEER